MDVHPQIVSIGIDPWPYINTFEKGLLTPSRTECIQLDHGKHIPPRWDEWKLRAKRL